jgi:predicted O-linked N-acetylglucosamine transferase (SPINDLY family)
MKNKLAHNRLTHPLFDTDLFRQDIENAYLAIWRAWRTGERP